MSELMSSQITPQEKNATKKMGSHYCNPSPTGGVRWKKKIRIVKRCVALGLFRRDSRPVAPSPTARARIRDE